MRKIAFFLTGIVLYFALNAVFNSEEDNSPFEWLEEKMKNLRDWFNERDPVLDFEE